VLGNQPVDLLIESLEVILAGGVQAVQLFRRKRFLFDAGASGSERLAVGYRQFNFIPA
jgi:hypothetical protein